MRNALFVADTRAHLIGALLEQIKEKSPNTFDEAIVYYTSLNENEKSALNEIMPCRFVEYKCPVSKRFFKLKQFKNFTALMFARYEMFNYLDEFDRIVWLDTDVLIQQDLDELVKMADATGFAMLQECVEDYSYSCGNINLSNFLKPLDDYRMDTELYSSGTIVLSKKLINFEKYTNWCYKKTEEYAKKLFFPDQAIFNILIQEFKINVKTISNSKYCCYPALGKDCSNAAIIHSWGCRKFWNNWYLHLKYPQWFNAYKKWLKRIDSNDEIEIKPEVSVVIPSYKPNIKYFKQCLDSLMNQKLTYENYDNFEIIIVAEPFNQKEIKALIDGYNDPRVKLIFNKEKLNISKSLNIGIKEAKGEFIARIDDDDIAFANRLYLQAQYLRNDSKTHLCTTDFVYFQDMNEIRIARSKDGLKALSLLTCPFDHPTVMFRKDFFVDNNLFYDENRSFCEDWDLWNRAFEKGMIAGGLNKILTKHRWHNGSAGQDNKTFELMNKTAAANFSKLGLELNEKESSLVRFYTGIVSKEDYLILENIFKQALKLNKTKKIYNQNELKRLFKIRLKEARKGYLSLNKTGKYFSVTETEKRIIYKFLFIKLKRKK